jgi:hypothetical protein
MIAAISDTSANSGLAGDTGGLETSVTTPVGILISTGNGFGAAVGTAAGTTGLSTPDKGTENLARKLSFSRLSTRPMRFRQTNATINAAGPDNASPMPIGTINTQNASITTPFYLPNHSQYRQYRRIPNQIHIIHLS